VLAGVYDFVVAVCVGVNGASGMVHHLPDVVVFYIISVVVLEYPAARVVSIAGD